MGTGIRSLDRTPETESGFNVRVRRNFDRIHQRTFTLSPFRRVTEDTTAGDDDADGTIGCDTTAGDIQVRLLTADGVAGRVHTVKNMGTAGNDVTVRAAPNELIDGAATVVLTDGQSVRLQVTDAKNWIVI